MLEENMRMRCDALLLALLGTPLAKDWWHFRNKAFDMLTPEEVWKTDPTKVYEYLLNYYE